VKSWPNFVASQLLWLAAVAGAGHGHWWPGPLAFLLFAFVQLAPRYRARGDVMLMLLALPVGLVVDSTMAATGLLHYASPFPSPYFAPVWILALWMGFALTFNHSLAWLMGRPVVAVLVGAIIGPFSYWVAARSWGAVGFTDPLGTVLLTLASLWGAAMGLFSHVVTRYAKARLLQTSTGVSL
jgi:hypothetical protein